MAIFFGHSSSHLSKLPLLDLCVYFLEHRRSSASCESTVATVRSGMRLRSLSLARFSLNALSTARNEVSAPSSVQTESLSSPVQTIVSLLIYTQKKKAKRVSVPLPRTPRIPKSNYRRSAFRVRNEAHWWYPESPRLPSSKGRPGICRFSTKSERFYVPGAGIIFHGDSVESCLIASILNATKQLKSLDTVQDAYEELQSHRKTHGCAVVV